MKARSTLKYVGVALFELILLVCAVQHVTPTTVETGGVRVGLANGCILYMGAVGDDACVLHGWQRVAQRQLVRDFAVQNGWPLPAGDFPFWGLFVERRSAGERIATYFGLPLWIPLAVMVGVVGILFRNDRRGVLAGPFHYSLTRVLGRLIFRCVRAFCGHRFWDRSHDSAAKRLVRIGGPVSCLLLAVTWIVSTQYSVRCTLFGIDGGVVIAGSFPGQPSGWSFERGSPQWFDAIDWPIQNFGPRVDFRIWFILLILSLPTLLAWRSEIADMIVGRRRRKKSGCVILVLKWFCLLACLPVLILWNLSYEYDVRYQSSVLDPPRIYALGTSFGGLYFSRIAIEISDKGLQQLRQNDRSYASKLFEPTGWVAQEVDHTGLSIGRRDEPVLPCASERAMPNPCRSSGPCEHDGNCEVRTASFSYRLAWMPFWPVLTVLLAIGLVLFWRDRRLPAGSCLTCGYNLTGNASGTCPECGTAAVTVAEESSRSVGTS